MSKRVTIQFPEWMIDSIIGQNCDNQAERVRELVQKGSMIETLEDATGKSFKELVKQRRTGQKNHVGDHDSGGTRPHSVGCLSGQWPEFIYNNPWTAKNQTQMHS